MNNDELFEEQVEQTEQLTEESSNPTEDVIEDGAAIESLYNRDEAERDTDRESELLERNQAVYLRVVGTSQTVLRHTL